jgi:PIN domain nuclease of toxin-antitoxin system
MSVPVLVDTHILIWARSEPGELNEAERLCLMNADRRLVSIVTFWELGNLNRLRQDKLEVDWFSMPDGFETISVTIDHCRAMADLPLHHRDPFDRMLIAQARTEGLGLLTRDRNVLRYGRLRDGLLIPD